MILNLDALSERVAEDCLYGDSFLCNLARGKRRYAHLIERARADAYGGLEDI